MAARLFATRTHKEPLTAAQWETSTAAQWEEPILKYDFQGHKGAIRSFVFLHDNVHIVSGSKDGTMRKWNYDTGLDVKQPWRCYGGRIYALALSPDGKMIACGMEDGSVQRWNTDGEMIQGVWTGHSDWVWSLSWSPSGSHIASGSSDGTILIRHTESGKVVVGPIYTEQDDLRALAYSPSGERIASGGSNGTICIWNTKTGKLLVGPVKNMDNTVTSLVWSLDNTKLYSASDRFARVSDSKTGELLHRFQHDCVLWSIALSPKHNVLACVGEQGIAQLWDTESYQPLGQQFDRQNFDRHNYVSFSKDGTHLAYGGSDKKLTVWMVKDIPLQLPAPAPPQQSDGHNIQQETRSNSPSLSCLNVDATGGDGFAVEAHNDPYNDFFLSFEQSTPSPSPKFRLPSLFSAARLLSIFSRHRSPADESVPKDYSKRRFFSRRTRSNASMTANPPVPEVKVGEDEGKRGDNVDDHTSTNGSLNGTNNKGKQRDDDPSSGAQSPPSNGRTPTQPLHSKDHRSLLKWLLQSRGENLTFGSLHSSTRSANVPQQTLRNPWQWIFSSFPAGSSRRPVSVAACRDEDRYGIAPETDAEAAAAMLRPNDDMVDCSTQPSRPAVGAQVPQGRPTQTQASTSRPYEEIEVSCCGLVFICRRRSNSHQP